MNDNEREALVDELAEAINGLLFDDLTKTRRVGPEQTASLVEQTCLPIIDRLLAAADAPEPGLDALLDSVKAFEVSVKSLANGTYWANFTASNSGIEETHEPWSMWHGTGPTRMDGIRNAVAQAAGITPSDAREGGEGAEGE